MRIEMKKNEEKLNINFFTLKELEETQKKIASTRYPNDYRSMQIKELLKKYKYLKTRKLVEEEIYIMKYSFMLFNNVTEYKIINRHEKEMTEYIMENKEEIMRVSMYNFIESRNCKYEKKETI